MQRIANALFTLVLLTSLSSLIWAQGLTGQISGSFVDASGAAVERAMHGAL